MNDFVMQVNPEVFFWQRNINTSVFNLNSLPNKSLIYNSLIDKYLINNFVIDKSLKRLLKFKSTYQIRYLSSAILTKHERVACYPAIYFHLRVTIFLA